MTGLNWLMLWSRPIEIYEIEIPGKEQPRTSRLPSWLSVCLGDENWDPRGSWLWLAELLSRDLEATTDSKMPSYTPSSAARKPG